MTVYIYEYFTFSDFSDSWLSSCFSADSSLAGAASVVEVVLTPGLPLARLIRGPGLNAGLAAPPAPTPSLPLGLCVVEETSEETEEATAESSLDSDFSSAGGAVVLVRPLAPPIGSLGLGRKLGEEVLL